MQENKKDGIMLIASLLKEISDPEIKLLSTIRQQTFHVFRVLTSDIMRLNFERDQVVMMAECDRFVKSRVRAY